MICYHNLGEIAHDVVTACPVRIGIKKRARCYDYWELPDTTPHPQGVERPKGTDSPTSGALPSMANARRPANAVDATTQRAWVYSGPGL